MMNVTTMMFQHPAAVRMYLALASLLSCLCLAQQAPKTMTKIEASLNSPEAEPWVMYRAGSGYCLMGKRHSVVIVNEPDVWIINLTTKTGRHLLDADSECQMPLFADDPEKESLGLEFGREMAFFKSIGATPEQGPVLQGKQTTQYIRVVGSSKLALFTYGMRQRPLAVVRVRGNIRDANGETIWYHAFDEVPFDARLFARPTGVKIDETKQ